MRLKLGILILSLVGACGDGGSGTPFGGQDVDDIATWLHGLESPSRGAIWLCGSQWKDGGANAVDPDDSDECNALAANLARRLSSAGFGRVSANDVPYPPLWKSYGDMRSNGVDFDAREEFYRNRGND